MLESWQTRGLDTWHGRILLHEDVSLYYWALMHAALTAPVTALGGDGEAVVLALPAAGAIARVGSRGTRQDPYGPAQYLTADALFGRYDDANSAVWLQDRMADDKPPVELPAVPFELLGQAAPTARAPGTGKGTQGAGGTGPGSMRAKADGRRPYINAWSDAEPGKTSSSKFGRQITFMGPAEEKLLDPYCIVVRGAGYGVHAAIEDHFAFPGHHWHIADHTGAATGKPMPDDRRSTRIYDVRRSTGKPWVDEIDDKGKRTRGMNAGLHYALKPVAQVTGCGGGIEGERTLAFYGSSESGQGHGLWTVDAMTPFIPGMVRPPSPVTGPDGVERAPRETTFQPTFTRLTGMLGFMFQSRGGPLSVGHPVDDKHFVGWAGAQPANSLHLHINAKWTNDSRFYDGRMNINPKVEPPVGHGVIPLRTKIEFRPSLPDPHRCDPNLRGGWDLHTPVTRMALCPTPYVPSEPPPVCEIPTPPYQPICPQASTPYSPVCETPSPPYQAICVNAPYFPEFPRCNNPPYAPPDPGGGGGDSRPPDDNPPVDWGPLETSVPSEEGQPTPGDDEIPGAAGESEDPPDWEDPFPGVPGGSDGWAGNDHPQWGMSDVGHADSALNVRAESGRGRGRGGPGDPWLSATNLYLSDHMLSPRVSHYKYFYRRSSVTPNARLRGIERNPPAYNQPSEFVPGKNLSEPARLVRGTADGVKLLMPPEFQGWQARVDVPAHRKPQSPSEPKMGFYPGYALAFGMLSADGGDVVRGVRLMQRNNEAHLTVTGLDDDAAPTFDHWLDLDVPLMLAGLTTTQRNALSPAAGLKIWNTSVAREQTYDGSTWREYPSTTDLTAALANYVTKNEHVAMGEWAQVEAGQLEAGNSTEVVVSSMVGANQVRGIDIDVLVWQEGGTNPNTGGRAVWAVITREAASTTLTLQDLATVQLDHGTELSVFDVAISSNQLVVQLTNSSGDGLIHYAVRARGHSAQSETWRLPEG